MFDSAGDQASSGVSVSSSATRLVGAALAGLAVASGPAPAEASFVTFESGQVRPLALSPDGSRLFAVNTPDNRLEIFAVSGRRR